MAPDSFSQTVRYGLDLTELEHLLVTHTHDDHLCLTEILGRECAVPVPPQPLHIYLNRAGIPWALGLLRAYMPRAGKAEMEAALDTYLPLLEVLRGLARAGDLEVTAVKANHRAFGEGEFGQNYIVKLQDGRRLFYALDTGWYGEETWEFLTGRRADILAMDCTFGGADRGPRPDGHLDIRSMLNMLERLQACGVVGSATRIYATHINHKHSLLHEEMQRVFGQSGFAVTVAYDGLEIL
jgi:phosphoribosyl 1,2-cyclic phosphate phosphodiesterase